MGKREVRVLPPLVHGKATGALEFFVDRINVTTDKCRSKRKEFSDLAVQILWWGETKPCFVRPQKVHFATSDTQKTVLNDAGDDYVKYEIKTKPKLFRSYLEKCDVLELVVVGGEVRREVIGSAFLRDLLRVVFTPDIRTSPLVDDSGDEIGEIVYHFVYVDVRTTLSDRDVQQGPECVFDAWHKSDLKFSLNLSEIRTPREVRSAPPIRVADDDGEKVESGSSKPRCNTPVTQRRSPSPNAVKMSGRWEKTKTSSRAAEKKPADVSAKSAGDAEKKTTTAQVARLKRPNLKAKEVAKVKASESKTAKTIPNKAKAACPRTGSALAGRSNKAAAAKAQGSEGLRSTVKPGVPFKTFRKVSDEISKVNKMFLEKSQESHTDLEEVPVRESCGDAREADTAEETASSENAVNDRGDFEERTSVEGGLRFDLNDPIERVYYETFFLKTDEGFGVADVLADEQGSRRQVRFAADEGESPPKVGGSPEDESDSLSRISEERGGEEEFRECKQSHAAAAAAAAAAAPPTDDCYRCKYYKKLSELDMIIDALKRFESNMRREAEGAYSEARTSPVSCDAVAREEGDDAEVNDPARPTRDEVESDFSKEDSDFVEFVQYMSQR